MRNELAEAYLYLFFLKCKVDDKSHSYKILQEASDTLINAFTESEWREVQKLRDDQIFSMIKEVTK